MTTICLVRHGETNWNAAGILQGQKDTPLNENGRVQAEESGQYLKNLEWDIMITSPLKRAKQTAEIIQKQLQLPLMEMPEFMERGYGAAEGLTPEDRASKFPDKAYPGQEERDSFILRVMLGIDKINEEHKGKTVLLVAHGAVINAILAELSSGEIGSGKTSLINACISNIEYKNEAWKIKNYNQVKHLSDYRIQEY